MSRQTTVNLGRVITQAPRGVLGLNVGWELRSLKPPSFSDSTHTLAACSHGTTLATNAPVDRTNPTCWCPLTKRACLFFTFPFGMILAWLGRESCQFLFGASRPVVHFASAPYSSPRVGTGSEWALLKSPLLIHVLAVQGWLRKNHIAPQRRRIVICEESQTNTQSQVSLAHTNVFEYKKRKPSQATESVSWVNHVSYAFRGVSQRGMKGADLEWLQSRGARFPRSGSLLALRFLPLSSFERVGW